MSRSIMALIISAGLCAAQADNEVRQKIEANLAAQLQQKPDNAGLLLKLGAMKMEDGSSLREADARASVFDEAQSYYERVLGQDANNIPALYSLGVLGWSRVFPELRTARAQLAMDPETSGPLRDRGMKAELSAKYSRVISDSIASLERVLAVDPENNDAMAYLNLVYRARADLADTPAAYQEDINTANQWVQKAFATANARHAIGISGASQPPAPPSLPIPAAQPPSSIRVGGAVQAANLIDKVEPIYPALAIQARIQGTVRFGATIGKDGKVEQLNVVSGHPILVQAALQAARQWVYKPTVLNGEPVAVVTTIDVNFTLP